MRNENLSGDEAWEMGVDFWKSLSEGMAGSVEFPPGPWQTMQAWAFCGTSSAVRAAQWEKKESAAANIAAALRLSFTSYRSSRGK